MAKIRQGPRARARDVVHSERDSCTVTSGISSFASAAGALGRIHHWMLPGAKRASHPRPRAPTAAAARGGGGGAGERQHAPVAASTAPASKGRLPCTKASVCNTGQYLGPIDTCLIIPVANGGACDDGKFCTVPGRLLRRRRVHRRRPEQLRPPPLSPCTSVLCSEDTKSLHDDAGRRRRCVHADRGSARSTASASSATASASPATARSRR